jgi:LmbE family N-acetylglucosaminyl deacetylase
VAIVTVFSGAGGDNSLSAYQREALGFGSKTHWPVTEAFNRAHIAADEPVYGGPERRPAWVATDDRLDATQADADAAAKRFWQRSSWYRRASVRNESLAGQPVIDDLPTQGAVLTEEIVDSAAAGEVMAKRRLEDERYALFAEASLVFLDLPDAVFRGYEGDDELLATPRDDDDAPYDVLRREIDRLEPQKLYLPLGVGNHVDHQLCRDVGTRLLAEGRRWVMPGPDYAGIVTFYEDSPYAWWNDFERIEELPAGVFDDLPGDVAISPEYADITDQLERKVSGIAIYESQMNRLFGGKADMGRQTRAYGRKVALLAGGGGAAERYWATRPV